MARKAIPTFKLISLVLMVVGAGLIFWGYDLADSIGGQISATLTGATPLDVIVRYIAGSAALTAGVFLYFRS